MMRSVLITLLFWAATALAQQPDPVIGYLISANENSWTTGGNLGLTRPADLELFSLDRHAPRFGLRLAGFYADYYRTGGLERSGSSYARALDGSAFASGWGRWPWIIRMESRHRTSQLLLSEAFSHQDVGATSSAWVPGVAAAVAIRSLQIGGGIQSSPDERLLPMLGASLRVGKLGTVEGVWKRERFDISTDLLWQDNVAHFRLDGLRETCGGRCAFSLPHRLRTELALTTSHWIREKNPRLEPTLEPWGNETSYHGFLAYNREAWEGRLGLRGMETDLSAYGMQGTDPWAKITRADLKTQALFVSVQNGFSPDHVMWLLELERMDCELYTRGHTEFWPFTSGFIDLLGLRRYFVADATATLWRLHAAGRKPLSKRWIGGVGVNLADWDLTAKLDHWRPEFLVFGKADEQSHVLNVNRVLAGLVSLSVEYRATSWSLACEAHQIVPIRVWRNETSSSSEPAPTAGGSSSHHSYGGAFHRLTFAWHL